MLSKSEILMSLNSKKKLLCQLATAELFPYETGKQQKSDKNVFGLDALDWWFFVYPTTRSLIS